MELETVIYEKQDSICLLQLNRPERMNAVIEQMYLDLQKSLAEARKDPDVRVVVLTGSVLKRPTGDKQAFCAGADLKKHASSERSPWQKRAYIMLAHETCHQLYAFPKPVIAAVNGPARGAGFELALNCDFILMAEQATLAFTETSLGTFVGGGATYHLTHMIGMQQAKHLIYTGKVIDGPMAVEMGLALRCVPIEQLRQEALELACSLVQKAPISMSFAKELIQLGTRRDLQTVLLSEAEAILACMTTVDWKEGIASFAEKRQPTFVGK